MSIAVVIPAYNSMKFFKETLDSVMAQTLPADEIIVVDDGSTDETAAFAESYGPPVRVFRRSNHRQAASRNFGAEQASSEWVAFLDHDDLWVNDKLERQAQELAKNPEVDLCYSAFIHLHQNGDSFNLGTIYKAPSVDDVGESLYRDFGFLPSSVLVRRSSFLAVGGFDTSFRYTEDWDLWLRLLHHGCRFACCPEPLLIYRVHDKNTSIAAFAQLEEISTIYRRHIVPNRPTRLGRIAEARFLSRYEANGAYNLRRGGSPRCLTMMFRSIRNWPIGDLNRYKVLAHMAYTRFGKSVRPG